MALVPSYPHNTGIPVVYYGKISEELIYILIYYIPKESQTSSCIKDKILFFTANCFEAEQRRNEDFDQCDSCTSPLRTARLRISGKAALDGGLMSSLTEEY